MTLKVELSSSNKVGFICFNEKTLKKLRLISHLQPHKLRKI